MASWNMRFEYDTSPGGTKLDSQIADTPEEAIAKTFSSQWNLVETTSDGYQPCYHYRMKDAHVTVYVWEQEGVCPDCGTDDPFTPTVENCLACRDAAGEVIKDAELSIGGWDRSP